VLLTSLDSCADVDVPPFYRYPLAYVCEENDSAALAGRVALMRRDSVGRSVFGPVRFTPVLGVDRTE
jgi:hypothetical protein